MIDRDDPNEILRRLVDRWCERRDYRPLAMVLPAWTGNSGLTDDWEALHAELRHAYAVCTSLPTDERDLLKRAYVSIEIGLRSRKLPPGPEMPTGPEPTDPPVAG